MLPDCLKKETVTFLGPWTRVDPYSVDMDHALFAQNVSYLKGQIAKRFGISSPYGGLLNDNSGHSLAGATAMTNWLPLVSGAPRNYILLFSTGNGVPAVNGVYYFTVDGTTIPPVTAPQIVADNVSKGAYFSDAGSRMYMGFYDANGVGSAGGQVFDPTGNWTDPLFPSPMIDLPVVTDSGAGLITAGLHRVGYLLTFRSGYTTQPCATVIVGSTPTFNPYPYSSAGSKTAQFSITATFPTGAATIQVIMTTSTNPNKYFLVPGAIVPVTAGLHTYTFTFSIDDIDLVEAEPADGFFDLLTTAPLSSTPPFKPSVIIPYLERMVYITVDALGFPVAYASDPSLYQSLTDKGHRISLPGNRRITTAFQLHGVLYLLGPHWTYSISDAGGTPVSWPGGPQLVDGAIGTLSPYGVYVNLALAYAWVADTEGLYLFLGGQYPQLPVSYHQADWWARINWNVPTKVFVFDNKDTKTVTVIAPLDGATLPTHRLTWDYTDGIDPSQVKFSPHIYSGFAPGCGAIVQNDATKILEQWMISATTGAVMRDNNGTEAHPYRDSIPTGSVPTNSPINTIYESALQPGQDGPHGFLHMHHGAHLRFRGNGAIQPTFFASDHSYSFNGGGNITLPATGQPEVFAPCNGFQNEHASLQIQENTLDGFFLLSKLTHYYTMSATRR